MSLNNTAAQAYGMTLHSSLSGRTLEARGFAEAANQLREARETPDDQRQLIKALRFNQQLWTLLQATLSQEENQVPPKITAKLLDLSVFVDKRTIEILQNLDNLSLLDALIDINRDMAQAQFS